MKSAPGLYGRRIEGTADPTFSRGSQSAIGVGTGVPAGSEGLPPAPAAWQAARTTAAAAVMKRLVVVRPARASRVRSCVMPDRETTAPKRLNWTETEMPGGDRSPPGADRPGQSVGLKKLSSV